MTDPEHLEGRLANLARWDEAAPLHAQSALYDLEGFRAGRTDIRPFEHDELGSVEGRELLHLQCHLGTDTLSWARHGARVSGLDFSPNATEIARTLAAECGIDAEFWCADVYDAVDAVGRRKFDIVYTGIGALGWLPDLDSWARVVADLLRRDGVLYLVEIHPSSSEWSTTVGLWTWTSSRPTSWRGTRRAAPMPYPTPSCNTGPRTNVSTP